MSGRGYSSSVPTAGNYTIPTAYCPVGKHFYPAYFTSCPVHRETLFNVRIRTKFHTIKKPDGSMTNDWTFQQKAPTGKLAARRVVDAVFGGQEAAEFHIRGIEVWAATKVGISPKDIWRGRAE